MPNPVGYLLGEAALAQIEELIQAYSRRVVAEQPRRGARSMRQALIEGILVEDLEAASDPEVGQTCARIQLLVGAPGDVEDLVSGSSTLSISSGAPCAENGRITDDPGSIITVVNRSIDLSLEAGTYVIAGWLNGQWRIIWADCGPSQDVSGSGSSFDFTSTGPDGGYGGGGYG